MESENKEKKYKMIVTTHLLRGTKQTWLAQLGTTCNFKQTHHLVDFRFQNCNVLHIIKKFTSTELHCFKPSYI